MIIKIENPETPYVDSYFMLKGKDPIFMLAPKRNLVFATMDISNQYRDSDFDYLLRPTRKFDCGFFSLNEFLNKNNKTPSINRFRLKTKGSKLNSFILDTIQNILMYSYPEKDKEIVSFYDVSNLDGIQLKSNKTVNNAPAFAQNPTTKQLFFIYTPDDEIIKFLDIKTYIEFLTIPTEITAPKKDFETVFVYTDNITIARSTNGTISMWGIKKNYNEFFKKYAQLCKEYKKRKNYDLKILFK